MASLKLWKDSMKSWKTPTPEQVDRAVALLGHAEQYRYFFDRLENPEWIGPLRSKGFLRDPPKAQRDEVHGTIGFPPWPESRYLARMASLRPKVVVDVILGIPDTDNTRVHEDLIEAVLAMPPELAAQLTEKAKTWARSPYQLLLPEKLGSLVAHLAKGGQVDKALELAQVLMEVLPDPRREEASGKEETYSFPPEPRARFDTWHYEQILEKNFPELVKAAGVRALDLLCDLLEATIRLSRRRDDEGPEDYSYIWRRAIEAHQQNESHGLKGVLVSAVRDAAEQIARANPTQVPALVEKLEGRRPPWHIFQRIALHLLRKFPDAVPTLIYERLTDRRRFEETGLWHEYALLARDRFDHLLLDGRERILGWIEAGPDPEELSARHEEWEELTGRKPTHEEVQKYANRWRLKRLAPIRDSLPPEWRRRYDEWVAELEEPEHPEFSSYSVSWTGPTSPKSGEDLRSMSASEIVTFLGTWRPSGEPMSPSPEGLGRVLAEVVASDPGRFVTEAGLFRELDPTYVRALLLGLRDAAKEKRVFPWPPILDLCCWVVEQPREIPGRQSEYHDLDPGWGWTRKTIADLLPTGFAEGPTEIPFDLRTSVWAALRPVTDDPDPTPEDEARYGGANMDPAHLSINTTRGEAMHAVMQYALWVRRHFAKQKDADQQLARGFAEMSEVREVLDIHLDPAHDPSLAIRSVYGRWFPWLVLLDPEWARSSVPKIFPMEEHLQDLYGAAWDTYIIFCSPYDNVLEILSEHYGTAVEHLGIATEGRQWLADPDEQLAEHLMTFYWRGKLDMGDPESQISKFWRKASDMLRGHALKFVGRSLNGTQGPVPPEILERLQSLWETRLAAAKRAPSPDTHRAEVAAFGWWFASGKFEDEWAMRQLIEALKLAGKVEPDHLVVERLAALVQVMPKEAVRCLEAIVKGDREGWGIYGWREHARIILVTALQSSDAEAITAAENLTHDLGSRGHLEFRDLLSRK